MKYGYARVSKDEQNPAMQKAALKKDGCEKILNSQEPPPTALPFSAV
jgi:DNA invertase Pin-like site-specific DNA recombinase